MDKNDLLEQLTGFVDMQSHNRISPSDALRPDLAGMRIYEPPLLGVADARDPLFRRLMEPEAVGPHYMLPADWLPRARTVISFFLPFTARVRRANAAVPRQPAPEWLHARIEGQAFLAEVCRHLVQFLQTYGGEAVCPLLDRRFRSCEVPNDPVMPPFTSNWSERHTAYICGLGTFGLSRGLITEKGVAGRFGSVITSLYLPPEPRPYTGLYDYCTGCGACIRACPAGAITAEHGKAHSPCKEFLDETKVRFAPRYGCGKCQTGVPCEHERPSRAAFDQ